MFYATHRTCHFFSKKKKKNKLHVLCVPICETHNAIKYTKIEDMWHTINIIYIYLLTFCFFSILLMFIFIYVFISYHRLYFFSKKIVSFVHFFFFFLKKWHDWHVTQKIQNLRMQKIWKNVLRQKKILSYVCTFFHILLIGAEESH